MQRPYSEQRHPSNLIWVPHLPPSASMSLMVAFSVIIPFLSKSLQLLPVTANRN